MFLSGMFSRSSLHENVRLCIISDMRLFSLKLAAFFGGCLACYLFQVKAGIAPALSAALTGLVGSFLHVPKFYERKGLHAAIYSGAFAGMISPELIKHPLHLVYLSIIGTVVYLLLKPKFLGFGGKLGAVSFIASLLFLITKGVW